MYAVLSCDLDTVDRHLQGYGFGDLPPCDLIYRTAVPRLLELFAELRVPGVLFVIARDAETQGGLLREAVRAGHEIASHSLTHPQPFRTLDDAALCEEIVTSRMRLQDAAGTAVIGFRAPAWDVDARVLGMVRGAGYRYDASIFPTPVLIASRVVEYRRSIGKRSIFDMDIVGHAFTPVRPYHLHNGAHPLIEFPIAVTPCLRLPVYHTMQYFLPRWLFDRSLRSLLRSKLPLCYEFHAADLLDLEKDGADARLARHPGMNLPVEQKRAALRDVLATIARARQVVTYSQASAQGFGL
jgi:hypothetical protein